MKYLPRALIALMFFVLPSTVLATQNPIVIQPDTGTQVIVNINAANQTLATAFAGPTAPASPIANQLWLDTSTNPQTLKMRDTANTSWLSVAPVTNQITLTGDLGGTLANPTVVGLHDAKGTGTNGSLDNISLNGTQNPTANRFKAVSELTEYDCTANGTNTLSACSPSVAGFQAGQGLVVKQGSTTSCTGALATPPTVSWADITNGNGGSAHTYIQVDNGVTIPSGSPPTYTPTTTATGRAFAYYQFSQGKNGAQLTNCNCTNPAAGQYGLSAGVFYFNTADTGKVVNLGYYVADATSWSYKVGYTTAGGSYCTPTTAATITGPPPTFVNPVYSILVQLSGTPPTGASGIYGMFCSGVSCTPTYSGWEPIMANFDHASMPNIVTPSGTASGKNVYRYFGHPYGSLGGATPPFPDDLLTTATQSTTNTLTLAAATAVSGAVKVFRDNSAAINAAEALCTRNNSLSPGTSLPVRLPPGAYEIAKSVGSPDGGWGCSLIGAGPGDQTDSTALVWVGPNGGTPVYVNHTTASDFENFSVVPNPNLEMQIGFGIDTESTSPVTAGTSRNMFKNLYIGPAAVGMAFGANGAQSNTDESVIDHVNILHGDDAWGGMFGYGDFHGQVKENILTDHSGIHSYGYDVYTTGGVTIRDTDVTGGQGGIGIIARGPVVAGPNVTCENCDKFYWDNGNIVSQFLGLRIGDPEQFGCEVGDQKLFDSGAGSTLLFQGFLHDQNCPQEMVGGSASIIADNNFVTNSNFFTSGLKNDSSAFISVGEKLVRAHNNIVRQDSGVGIAMPNLTTGIADLDLNSMVLVNNHALLCDGTTDNAAVINGVITGFGGKGGVLQFKAPAGNLSCNIGSTINLTESIALEGLTGNCHDASVSSACVNLHYTGAGGAALAATDTSGIQIKNLLITFGGSGNAVGIKLTGVTRALISGAMVTGFYDNLEVLVDNTASSIWNKFTHTDFSSGTHRNIVLDSTGSSNGKAIEGNEFDDVLANNSTDSGSPGQVQITGTNTGNNRFISVDTSSNAAIIPGIRIDNNSGSGTLIDGQISENSSPPISLGANVRGLRGGPTECSLANSITSGSCITADPTATYDIAFSQYGGGNSSERRHQGADKFTYVEPATLQDSVGDNGIGQMTNLLTYSEDYTQAAWTKGAGVTVGANATTIPDGSASTAQSLTLNVGSQILSQSVSLGSSIASTCFTLSAWMKTNSGALIGGLQIVDGTTPFAGLSTGSTSHPLITPNWRRHSVTQCAAVGDTNTSVFAQVFNPPITEANGTVIYVWGVQLSQTSQPLPYVKTTSTALTTSKVGGVFASLGVGTAPDGTPGDIIASDFTETGLAPNACVNQDASPTTNSAMSLQNNCSHSNPAIALKTNAGGSNNLPGIVLGPETSSSDTAPDAAIYRDASGNLVVSPKTGQVIKLSSTTIGSGTQVNKLTKYTVSLSPASVNANTCAEQTFTVTGVTTTDMIFGFTKPTSQAGLGIGGVRQAGANAVAINFCNLTASPITPTASETYSLMAITF